MAKARGRRSFHEATEAWSVRIPVTLKAKVDLLLTDPLTGEIKYGSRTQLTEQLLREWLTKQQQLFSSKGEEATGFEPDPGRYAGNRGDEATE